MRRLVITIAIGMAVGFAGTVAGQGCGDPAPVQPGTVLLLHLDEGSGTTAADASGNGNTGTLIGGVLWNLCGGGTASVTLDGLDDYIQVAAGTALRNVPRGPYAIEAKIRIWAYPSEIDFVVDALGADQNGLRILPGGKALFKWVPDGNPYGGRTVESRDPVPLGRCVTLRGEWDGSFGRIFLDGELQGLAPGAGAGDTWSLLHVGRISAGGGGNLNFAGDIDEVVITPLEPFQATRRLLYLKQGDPAQWTIPGGYGSQYRELLEWLSAGYQPTTMNLRTTFITTELLSAFDALRINSYSWNRPLGDEEGAAIAAWIAAGGRMLADTPSDSDIPAVRALGVAAIDGEGGGSSGLDWTYHGAPWRFGPVASPLAVGQVASEVMDRPVLVAGAGLAVDASVDGFPVITHRDYGCGRAVISFTTGWNHDRTFPGNAYRSDIYQADNLRLLQKVIAYVSGQPADSLPSTGRIDLAGTLGANGWYVGPVTATVTAEDGQCGSGVAGIETSLDGGASWLPYGEPLMIDAEGLTTVLAHATDAAGNLEDPPVSAVVRIDLQAPAVSASATPASLWPPTGKPVDVTVSLAATDSASGVAGVTVVSAVSSEGTNAHEPDIVQLDLYRWRLRSERDGNGTGRTYTLTYRVSDYAGHSVDVPVTVTVAHNQER